MEPKILTDFQINVFEYPTPNICSINRLKVTFSKLVRAVLGVIVAVMFINSTIVRKFCLIKKKNGII